MTRSLKTRPPNRLIHETSPYLLQHASNPVDWYPWGEEALQQAKAENKPILLSIGYSACHWCHVMEQESFENEAIADLMNRHYINIKVDREERPDLDEIYMQATLAMNQGHGGWPMTVFLTPDQEPIFAGTYFPPTDRWGRPGFSTVLRNIAEAWQKDQRSLVEQAARFTARLRASIHTLSPMAVGLSELQEGVDQFARDFDARYGGFGRAPKFPPATGLSFLLRQYVRKGDAHTLQMVQQTLDAMAAGGIYDHLGGGFARYSTDERWLVPHFEKMLYDNALLARTYVEAAQVTGLSAYQRVAEHTLDYVLREMTAPEGGFYSSTDADSEGVEGKFFVWTPDQVREALTDPEDARRFCAYFDITPEGNWEGVSIPNIPRPLEEVAQALNCTSEDLKSTIARVLPIMYQARLNRVPPARDDKVITAWNGMMIGAMAEAGRVFGAQRFLDAAKQAADFVMTAMSRPEGRLYRTYRAGKAHLEACLEDYAFTAEALIDLYEACGEERYLYEALNLATRLLEDFVDSEHGGFYTTGNRHEPLILRGREGSDGATPSGNAVAASALARLAAHFQRDDFREAAVHAIRAYGQHIAQVPRGFAKSLMVVDFLLNGPVELALVGHTDDPSYEALCREVHRHFLPNRLIAYGRMAPSVTTHPLLRDKTSIDGRATLYICRHQTCGPPITDPQGVAEFLRASMDVPREDPPQFSSTLTGRGIPGKATPEGTRTYASKILANPRPDHPRAEAYTTFGSTGLTTSRLGFGGYRVDPHVEDHRRALTQSLRAGINLIDTSTNYADGGSERLIGEVLAHLITSGEMAREEILVVSKIGYVQGQNLRLAETRAQAGNPYPDMVKYGEGIWHCIHPEFLDDQFTRSLDRLGLATLDVCLLHNPEYFLSDIKHQRPDLARAQLQENRNELYRRLRDAFRYFEHLVSSGRLQYYGVSSNTCTAEPEDLEALSLSRMLEAAHEAARTHGATSHHFRVIQFPMNLFEPGALFTANTGPSQSHTILELAGREQLAVLVNRPLNALPAKNAGMFRLADPRAEPPETTFEAQYAKVSALETEYQSTLAPRIPQEDSAHPAKEYFRWAEELTRLRPGIQGLEHWDQIESHMIAPHVNQVFQVLTRHFSGDTASQKAWEHWRDRYVPEFLALLKVLRMEAAEKNARRIHALQQIIDPLLPDHRRTEPLARKALWILSSTPGVTSVLNGMRQPTYVEDALRVLGWEPLSDVRILYDSVRKALTTNNPTS